MKHIMLRTVILFLTLGSTCMLLADDDDDDDDWGKGEKGRSAQSDPRAIAAATNTVYRLECASCHMLYPPGLLPSRSWNAIMSDLKNHFGENATIDAPSAKTIGQFLDQNSADRSNLRRSQKIAASIADRDAPIRFSETNYFKRKHNELGSKVWARKSIGSRANCVACHSKAESGIFSEDQVRIPR